MSDVNVSPVPDSDDDVLDPDVTQEDVEAARNDTTQDEPDEDGDTAYSNDSVEATDEPLADDNPVHDPNPTEIQDDEVDADGGAA